MDAKGGDSGKEYSKTDILNDRIYAQMREETLLNKSDELVIPVRNQDSPHFRRIGSPSFGTRIGRAENNPIHNECVAELHRLLSAPDTKKIKVSTNVFRDNGERDSQVIFSTHAEADYRWFTEVGSRVGFHEKTYIQPDLSGRDANKFFPTSASPNLIIEVIKTHSPEEKTLERLYELSRENTIVVFFFINDNPKSNKYNSFKLTDDHLAIRAWRYMIDGVLYTNGDEKVKRYENESIEAWCQRASNAYFKQAKELAAKA